MRRMLLSLAAGISVALLAVSIVMWVRSYWADNQLHWVLVRNIPSNSINEVDGEHVRLSSGRGKLALTVMRSRKPYYREPRLPVDWNGGPAISRWTWTDDPDDLNQVRKAAKKCER